MFSFNKTVVCVEFSKTAVFCALAQISGRKVDIIAIDSIQIDSGILEEGVIYDSPHLQEVVKNLITSVSKTYNKIDSAWVVIPDNKTLITKFEVEKDKKGVREDELYKSIEEKFNYSASKLYLINRPIHEINNKIFFLSHAIRMENLEPFIELFESLNIPVETIFPTFQCIFEESRSNFQVPTLLLYPSSKGYKFFLGDSHGVYLESVWGHNVIEFNENFDKAIEEIIQYTKQSKEVAIGIKKILIVESPKHDSDEVQKKLQKIDIEHSWIPSSPDSEYDEVSLIILKGLIKAAMSKDFGKGFLEPQITHKDIENGFTAPILKSISQHTPVVSDEAPKKTNTNPNSYGRSISVNNDKDYEEEASEKWNWKVIVGSVLLGALLLGLFAYAGTKVASRTAKNNSNTTAQVTPTPTSVAENITTPTPTVTVSPTVTPSIAALTKKDVSVQVLNGNNTAGEASRINTVLKNNDFQVKAPANSTVKNVQTTTVTYKDERAKSLAEEIVKILEKSDYPSAQSVYDANAKDDIQVLLGAK